MKERNMKYTPPSFWYELSPRERILKNVVNECTSPPSAVLQRGLQYTTKHGENLAIFVSHISRTHKWTAKCTSRPPDPRELLKAGKRDKAQGWLSRVLCIWRRGNFQRHIQTPISAVDANIRGLCPRKGSNVVTLFCVVYQEGTLSCGAARHFTGCNCTQRDTPRSSRHSVSWKYPRCTFYLHEGSALTLSVIPRAEGSLLAGHLMSHFAVNPMVVFTFP